MPIIGVQAYARIIELNVRLWNQHKGKPLVIGFHAPKGTGKDSTALGMREVAERYEEHEPWVSAIADPLYKAVAVITDMDVDWLQDQVNKNRPFTEADTPVSTLWGKTPRFLLEMLGTEFVRNCISPNHWVSLKRGLIAFKHDQGIFWHLITDIRFSEECAICDVVIELRRKGIEYGGEADHVSTRRLPAEFITDTIWLDAYERTPEAYVELYQRILTTALDATKNKV